MIPRTIEQTRWSVAPVSILRVKAKGCFKNSKRFLWLCFGLLVVVFLHASAAALVHGSFALAEGHWEGAITRDGKTWRVNLDFESRPTGPVALIDLVDYAVYDIPFAVTADSNKLHLERKQPTGATISFNGLIEGDEFSGEFTGVGVTAPFTLKRTDKTPVVFKEQEVNFHNGDVTLAGTLIIPKGPGPYPAIVVTHGSGPDGRQKASYRSEGYFFAHLGLAALIYDKRGVRRLNGGFSDCERRGSR